ncbi:hypothetical protein [Massilia antarctica]|uniref:hypothetical protein n=1 Tax=Massilia antarctica TaxID=2765360 RepID=UPI0011AEDE22|nr:hypothetical protein [Massilia sp. H27-R4]MCY0911409.1 hypothetical protein [Massilia sp. H27-R4]
MGIISQMLLRELSAIVGEECWGVVGGEGTGSVILLYIGARTLRPRSLKNPHLSDLVRRYDGAYSLRIECPWRIDSPSEVVAGSHMSNANDGPMVRGFKLICGQNITSVSCSGPAFDLTIRFENQHALVIHCAQIDWDYDTCYTFGAPAGYYKVALNGKVSFHAT